MEHTDIGLAGWLSPASGNRGSTPKAAATGPLKGERVALLGAAGDGALPKWRYTASIGYDYDPVALTLAACGFSAGKINTAYVECSSACPRSTTAHHTINDNHMPGAIYFDANATVKLTAGTEAFVAVDNIANKDPYQMPTDPVLVSLR